MRRITTVATIYVAATAVAAKKYGLAYHRKSLCCLLVLKRPKLLSALRSTTEGAKWAKNYQSRLSEEFIQIRSATLLNQITLNLMNKY